MALGSQGHPIFHDFSRGTAAETFDAFMPHTYPTGPLPKLLAGDGRNAVENFVNTYGGLVWSIAKSNTSTPEEAEMETSEIFLDIWRSAEKFESSRLNEASFIYAVARCRIRGLSGENSGRGAKPFNTSLAETSISPLRGGLASFSKEE